MEYKQSNLLVRDLLLVIGDTDLRTRKQNAYLTETWFHKLLFDLKKRVENPEVKQALQFYWYKHGPFSETVKRELGNLVDEKQFSKIRNEHGFVMYHFEGTPKMSKEECFNEARVVLDQIMRETDLFNLKAKMKQIYADAPYEFMGQYKFDYLERITEFKEFIDIGEDNQEFLQNYKGTVIESLYNCEACLPTDETFSEFNQIFANMVGDLTNFLSQDTPIDLFLLGESIKVSKEAWECFTKGIRIEWHDPLYEEKISFWKRDFSDCIKGFNKTVALLSEELLKKYSDTSLGDIEPKTGANTIMKAIVLGYTNE